MLHLIQKLDRGRWKTVAIATDGATGQDRLERAVGATPTARFRLVAMVDGAEKLIRQVDPRLTDLLPADPVPVLVPPSDGPPAPTTPPAPSLVAIEPFIPPPAQIPTQFAPIATVRSRSFNPLRLALQIGGAVILVLVLAENVVAVSDRMRAGAEPPRSAPALPIETLVDDRTMDQPAERAIVGQEPEVLPEREPAQEAPAVSTDFPTNKNEPPVMAVADQLPDLSIPDCRTLAQAQARFASRIDVTGLVQARSDHVEGADLSFQTVFGDWRPIRYRCRLAPGGRVRLVDIQLIQAKK